MPEAKDGHSIFDPFYLYDFNSNLDYYYLY